jgi:hypothetical protein
MFLDWHNRVQQTTKYTKNTTVKTSCVEGCFNPEGHTLLWPRGREAERNVSSIAIYVTMKTIIARLNALCHAFSLGT